MKQSDSKIQKYPTVSCFTTIYYYIHNFKISNNTLALKYLDIGKHHLLPL